jgi:hypothetical protein
MAHTEVDTPVYTPQSGALGDYFTFRMMVSPVMIRIVYALGAIGITIASFPLMFHGSDTTYTNLV